MHELRIQNYISFVCRGKANVYKGCFIIAITATALVVIVCLNFDFQLRGEILQPTSLLNSSTSELHAQILQLVNSTTNSSFDQSFIDLLPRSAYFDNRHRDGHDNATVILVQVSKLAIREKRIVGCGVDEHFKTKGFSFKILDLFKWIHEHSPTLTHDDAWVICYDLPAHQGSRTFVLFNDKTRGILKIETERRLYVPSLAYRTAKENATRTLNFANTWNSSILVCTTMHHKPTWLREWLVYQKTIGVDFIHIYAQESFIAEGGANNSVLQSYLKSGYAKLDVRKAFLNRSQDFYYQQPLLYIDCIYRYRTEFDYALLYDTDDFFVPLVPGVTDIHYYAKRLFNEKIAAVPFKWTNYYPDCGLTTRPENIKDGNVTKHLAFKLRHGRDENKSMYKLSGVVEVQIHNVVTLMPGYVCSATPDLAYVAHNRRFIKPHNKELLQECQHLLKKFS